jgi:FeS assembly SUF system protein
MKELPVIQSQAADPAPESADTVGMVDDPAKSAALRPQIVEALSKVFDPEIPVNIYELGLIYDIIVDAAGVVGIRMTLTAPACPAAQSLPVEVKMRVGEIAGVADVRVDIVWDPPWDRDRMSDAAKLQLGMF